ncbi:MAG: FG-GAP-like repeat-containing protein [Planctomycetota bacterium]
MRSRFPLPLAVFLLLILAASAAYGAPRGIPTLSGDKITSAVTPAGDVDVFVFDGMVGDVVTLGLAPAKGSALVPTLEILDVDGTPLDLTAHLKVKKDVKFTVKKLVLPATGTYAILVAGREDATGGYQLKWKAKPAKKWKVELELGPGVEDREFLFPAMTNSVVKVKIKDKAGAGFDVLSAFQPDGEEIAGGIAAFVTKKTTTAATIYPARGLGDYGFRFGNAPTETTLVLSVKAKHPLLKGWKRTISPDEPLIDSVEPSIGRENTVVAIIGTGFQPGASVFFGDTPAKSSTFVFATRIEAVAPAGEGTVSIAVQNQDYQEGQLEDCYSYLPPPPVATTVSPREGPDFGGTVVDVVGKNMSDVVEIAIDDDVLSTPPEVISETRIRFTTEAHDPGWVTLHLTDRFGQTETRASAFLFIGPPALTSVLPSSGPVLGGTSVSVSGTGLGRVVALSFDGEDVSSFTLVGDTTLVFTTPAHAEGTVDIAVEDEWGRVATLTDAFEFTESSFEDKTATLMPANSASAFWGGDRLITGDLDGDSDIDLGLGQATGSLTPLARVAKNSSGSFGAGSALPTAAATGDNWSVSDFAFGDVDGDSDLDLVVTTESKFYGATFLVKVGTLLYYNYKTPPFSSTRVLLNDGSGTFTQKTTAMPNPLKATTDLFQGSAVDLGDVDGDGDLDMLITRSQAAEVSTWSKVSSGWVGIYDIVFTVAPSTSTPATRVLLNDGKGVFTESASALPSVSSGDLFAGDDVLLGDIDGDSSIDIVLTGDGSKLRDATATEYVSGSKTRILINGGTGSFTNATSTMFPSTGSGDDWGGMALAMGDLDGDSDKDLVITTSRSITSGSTSLPSTRVFVKSATSFAHDASALPTVRTDGQGEMWRGVDLAIADLNGDGVPEIVLIDSAQVLRLSAQSGKFDRQVSSTRLLTNDGTGSFSDSTESRLPDPQVTGDFYLGHAVRVGDVDGDSDNDIILTTNLSGYTGIGKRPTRVLTFE